MSRILGFNRVIGQKKEKNRGNYKLISHCIIVINSVIFNYKIAGLYIDLKWMHDYSKSCIWPETSFSPQV